MHEIEIKQFLTELNSGTPNFEVLFSGKKSKKIDGLYYPSKKEILLHNLNFISDAFLLYTAMHEFAHHIHFTTSLTATKSNGHSTEYWAIFHELLFIAEKKGMWQNPLKNECTSLLQIHTQYSELSNKFANEVAKLSVREKDQSLFFDYMTRILKISKKEVKALLKVDFLKIDLKDTWIGSALKVVATKKCEDWMIDSLKEGQPETIETLKVKMSNEVDYKSEKELLEQQEQSLLTRIQKAQNELDSVRNKLNKI